MQSDHYRVLELARDASPEDIQRSYRNLALRYHPDRNAAPEAAARMSAINEAWKVLGDPQRRRDYDASLAKPAMNPEFAAAILLAARDVLLRAGWRVTEDNGRTMVLENGRQKLRVILLNRVDNDMLLGIVQQFEEFCVARALNVEGPIGPSAAAIDLLKSEQHGAPFPDASGRSLFAPFLQRSQ
jgi:curved DNA-binding protein CbpA